MQKNEFSRLTIPDAEEVSVPVNSSTRRRRSIGNFHLLCLDVSIDKQTEDEMKRFICNIEAFSTIDACLDYLETIDEENIVLIVSDRLGARIVPSIHDDSQLVSIFIFCSGKRKPQRWSKKFEKVRGIFTDTGPLWEEVKKSIFQANRDIIGFKFAENSADSSEPKDKQQATFMYNQLFMDILLKLEDQDLPAMIEYCQVRYKNRPAQLAEIREFSRDFHGHSPIWWYTRNMFVYKMVNKALRMSEYDTIFALHVFIRLLHEQISELARHSSFKQPFLLFRGLPMPNEVFNELKAKCGGLLSVSNFLSTTVNEAFARILAGQDNEETTAVLMIIQVDPLIKSNAPFADIGELSVFEEEQEYLFSMGSVFRIISVEREEDEVWKVVMKLTSDHDCQLTQLKERMKKDIGNRNPFTMFGKLMMEMGDGQRSEYFLKKALVKENDPNRCASIFNDLGRTCLESNDLDNALIYYKQSYAYRRLHTEEDDPSFAAYFNNIAMVYEKQNKLDLAFEGLQRALELHLSSAKRDESEIAITYNNIGGVLLHQDKHDEALLYFHRALDIEVRILPSNHPSLATTYNNIAGSLYLTGRLLEAIDYEERAVDIDLAALPIGHPQIEQHQSHLDYFRRQKLEQ